MQTTSLNFDNAFEASERKIYARVTIGDATYTESDIFSIDFESGSINGPGYQIGSVFSDYITITLAKIVRGISDLDKVIVELGIEREAVPTARQYNSKVGQMRTNGYLNKFFYDKPIEFARLGTFYVSEHVDVDENEKTTTITCRDSIIFTEGIYKPKISYPAKIFDVAADACSQAGIDLDIESFSQLPSKKISKKPTGLTVRQIIGYISQYVAGYVKLSKYDVLQLKSSRDTVKVLNTDLYYSKGFIKNDLKYKITGMTNTIPDKDTEIKIGSDTGTQLILENPFLNETDLKDIFKIIEKVEYYPFELNWRGNPKIEAGDWLIVEDVQKNQYKVPNVNYKITYDGGLKAISNAEADTASVNIASYSSKRDASIKSIAAQVAEVSDNKISKDGIIESINLSEEIDTVGQALRISPRKIRVGSETLIDGGTVPGEALSGNSVDGQLFINFDTREIQSQSSKSDLIKLFNGSLVFQNDAQCSTSIDTEKVENIVVAGIDQIKPIIENTDVATFNYVGINQQKLGLIKTDVLNIDDRLLNDEGNVIDSQLLYAMLVIIKNMDQRIQELESRGGI